MNEEAQQIKPSDIRVLHTRASIEENLRQLTTDHELHEITVSLLCKAAGVSRPTFYQHYGSVEEVSAAIVVQSLEALRARMLEARGALDLPGLLSLLQEHTNDLQQVMGRSAMQPKVRAVTNRWLQERMAQSVYKLSVDELDAQQRLRIVFAVGGLCAALYDSLSSAGSVDQDELAQQLLTLLRDTFGAQFSVSAS